MCVCACARAYTCTYAPVCADERAHVLRLLASVFQVLFNVLLVCEPGLRCADPAADSQLETTLPLLPLVLTRSTSQIVSLLLAHVWE